MLFSNYSTDSNKTITVVLFKIFLIFTIYFNSIVQAHAGAEKWVVEKVVYESVAKVVDVTAKRATAVASNDPFYKARVPVTAGATGSTVASMARLGILGAVIYGIIQGVGWVIENGVIKKPINNTIENWEYIYYCNGTPGESANSACNAYLNQAKQLGWFPSSMNVSSCTRVDISTNRGSCLFSDGNTSFSITYDYVKNPNYVPSTTLVPVSETDIGNEVNNSPQAPQVLPDIYNPNNPAGGQAPQSTSDALDNANPQTETDPTGSTKPKPNVDTDGDGKPDVYDPDKPSVGEDFTLPEFCSWAITVCEWYKKYKEDSKQAEAQRESEKVAWQREEIARQQEESQREKERSFWQKIEDFGGSIRDYFKDDEKRDEDNEVDVDDQPEQVDKVTVSIGDNTCPSMPVSLHIPFATIETNLSPTYLCEIAQGMKAFWVAFGLYTASLIVGRRN
ncbi:hypothetical protein [Acinetobacter bereziniae]|uniref:hypothetical protein n=1 Tax=Acinetobacter bereziniae TaxID=106648 RepID=UPI001D0E5523|nr:hypothetical protein [Acinetobacter bereziniae]